MIDGYLVLWIVGMSAVLGVLIWIGTTLHRLTELLARIGVHLVLITTGHTHIDMMKAAQYTERHLDNLYGPDIELRYPLALFRRDDNLRED